MSHLFSCCFFSSPFSVGFFSLALLSSSPFSVGFQRDFFFMGSALHKDGHKDGHHQMSFNKKGRGEEEEEEKRPLRTHMKVLILGAPEVGKHSICEILSRNSDFGKWHHQDRERDSFFTSRMIGETEYSLELVLPPHEQKEDELVLVRPNGDPEAEKEWVTKMRERTKRRATQKKELYWKMAEARGYLIVYSATDPPSLKRLLGYVVTIVRVTGFLCFSFFFSFLLFSFFFSFFF